MLLEWKVTCYRNQGVPAGARWIKCDWRACSLWNSNYSTRAASLSSTEVGTWRSSWDCGNETMSANHSVVARHWQRGGVFVHGCQLVSQPPKPEPVTHTELPSVPWQHLAANLLGPLPSGDYVLVMVDYYSHLFEMEFTKSITSERTV